MRVHIGLEFLQNLAIAHLDRRDFRDFLMLRLQAGGLSIKAHKGFCQRRVIGAPHHRYIAGIVDIICLHAVQHLDVNFVAFNGMHGLRKRLRHAMVCDGNGLMSPVLCPLHQVLGGGHAVHGGHVGVQMQLHALLFRCIHAYFLLALHNTGGIHDGLFFKVIIADLALYRQVHAGLDEIHIFPGLFLCQEFAHTHGTMQVGDIKAHLNPFLAGILALDFPGFHKENLAADGGAVHRSQCLRNRHHRLVKQPAIQHGFILFHVKCLAVIAHLTLIRLHRLPFGLFLLFRCLCRCCRGNLLQLCFTALFGFLYRLLLRSFIRVHSCDRAVQPGFRTDHLRQLPQVGGQIIHAG